VTYRDDGRQHDQCGMAASIQQLICARPVTMMWNNTCLIASVLREQGVEIRIQTRAALKSAVNDARPLAINQAER